MSFEEYLRPPSTQATVAADKVRVKPRRKPRGGYSFRIDIGADVVREMRWIWGASAEHKQIPLELVAAFGVGKDAGKLRLEAAPAHKSGWPCRRNGAGVASVIISHYPPEMTPAADAAPVEVVPQILPGVTGADNTPTLVFKIPPAVLAAADEAA